MTENKNSKEIRLEELTWKEFIEELEESGEPLTIQLSVNKMKEIVSDAEEYYRGKKIKERECGVCGEDFLVPTGFLENYVCPDCWMKKGRKQQRQKIIELIEEMFDNEPIGDGWIIGRNSVLRNLKQKLKDGDPD